MSLTFSLPNILTNLGSESTNFDPPELEKTGGVRSARAKYECIAILDVLRDESILEENASMDFISRAKSYPRYCL